MARRLLLLTMIAVGLLGFSGPEQLIAQESQVNAETEALAEAEAELAEAMERQRAQQQQQSQATSATAQAINSGSKPDGQSAAATPPPSNEVPYSQRPEQIETFTKYYLEMYEKHLNEQDWMARVMGIISLAKIDDTRSTRRLMQVLRSDKNTIARIYAWEAIHGRHTKLDEESRDIWVRIGFDLFEKDLLRGDLRLGIVGLIEAGGPTPQNKARLMKIFNDTNSINPSDIRTLWAVGDVIKRWQSGDMVRRLIEAMGTLDLAYRAELVLRRFETNIPHHTKYRRESSATMWQNTQRSWAEWYQEQDFKEVAVADVPPYEKLSEVMPHGEPITDTADPKWRKDLELQRFRLDQLDVCFVLDTTATMGRPLEWIKQDVVKMMRTFELISREPRIGVTLYRDHGDAYVTKTLPLSHRADVLAKLLRPEGPKGGGDIPEALLDGLVAAIRGQRWSRGSNAKKIVVAITDAPAHEKTVEAIEKFVKEQTEKGFQFHGVKVRTSKYVEDRLKLPNWDRQLTSIDKLAAAGNGQSLWVAFWTQSQNNPRWCGTASPAEGNTAERAIFRQVMRAALENNYHDRIDPFIGVLLEYVEEPVVEKRKPFGKAGPSRPSTPSDPQMNR